jgi:hypothetical protein
MKVKMLIGAAALAVSSAFATSALAAPVQSPTEVTIAGQNGDYHGRVKSNDKTNCENDRTVKVYKMLGGSPSPSTDQKIGTDTAEPDGAHASWSIGNSGYKHGKFYARVGKTDYCGADRSPVIVR